MTPDETQLIASLTTSSFRAFVREFWHTACSDAYVETKLGACLCEHMQALAAGDIKRLAIACPIRHGKSLWASVFFPAWLWTQDPSTRILSATYSNDLTTRDSLRTRRIIESDLYKQCFGHLFSLDDEQNRKDYYSNDCFGHRQAVSVKSATAGKDADVIICDDLHDYQTRKSQAEMTAALDYFENTLSNRLVKGRGTDRILLAGHRVAEGDVFGHLISNSDGWTFLVLPGQGPSPTKLYNGIGWTDWRKPDEYLCPERLKPADYEGDKKRLRQDWFTIYQQDASPAEGNLFNPGWFKTYKEEEGQYVLGSKRYKVEQCSRVALTDLAVSEKQEADFTVCMIADLIDGNIIIKHIGRGKFDGAKVMPWLIANYDAYRPQFMLVEDVAFQRVAIDVLKRAGVIVKKYRPGKGNDKESRSLAAQVKAEAGQIWIPDGAAWVGDFLHEVAVFPAGRHDDMVDCLSMAAAMSHRYDAQPEEEVKELTQEERVKAHNEHLRKMMWAGIKD